MSLTHLDEQGRARMVDVTGKAITARMAVAEGFVVMQPTTRDRFFDGGLPKAGAAEAVATARLAGIMGAKQTGALIPLCHPLTLDSIEVSIERDGVDRVRIEATARITAKTGVEMEALTAASVAALTIYDLCKAIDRSIEITGIRLLKNTGGSRGDFEAK